MDSGDIPHAAVFSYIYSLPFGRGKKFGSSFSKPVDAFLGGWQISGITSFKMGIPIAINGNLNAGSVFGGGQHANVIGNPNQITQRGVTSWFNTSAFAAAAPGTFGNAPRYFSNLRAPGYDDTDLSVSKWFDTKDVIRTQFRVEAFNVFNHSNLGPPTNVTLGTSNFGTIVRCRYRETDSAGAQNLLVIAVIGCYLSSAAVVFVSWFSSTTSSRTGFSSMHFLSLQNR